MTDRLPPIPAEKLSEAQRAAAQAVIDGPRGALYGPFVPLLRSPALMTAAQQMGEYLRYRSAIGTRLSELAILITARQWDQQVEWAIHAPIAARHGIAPAAIDAIARGQRPAALPADEALVHDFCIELQRDRAVSDATYDAALGTFGEQGRGRPDGPVRLLHLPGDGDERRAHAGAGIDGSTAAAFINQTI